MQQDSAVGAGGWQIHETLLSRLSHTKNKNVCNLFSVKRWDGKSGYKIMVWERLIHETQLSHNKKMSRTFSQ